jgi:hypothetical protein
VAEQGRVPKWVGQVAVVAVPDATADGNVTPMPSPSVLSLLRERAGLQPNDADFSGVAPPDTTIVSWLSARSACCWPAIAPTLPVVVEQYRHRQFTRLDA